MFNTKKEYLVWIEIGGDMENYERDQINYRICRGENESEAIKEWFEQFYYYYTQDNIDNKHHHGRKIKTVELIKKGWKDLNWSQ